MKTRVLLVDDHTLVRAGVRSLVEKVPNVEVIGEVGNGREAYEFVKQHRPDLVLMDVAMSGLNGLEATRRLTADFPEVRVLMLSMHDDEEYMLHASRIGAAGYLLKNAAVAELSVAIETVVAGGTYFQPSITARSKESVPSAGYGRHRLLDQLTPRQREILQLIAEGNSTKEIAFTLGVSAKTVETHRAQLMDRLDIHDVPGLVRLAVGVGLVQP